MAGALQVPLLLHLYKARNPGRKAVGVSAFTGWGRSQEWAGLTEKNGKCAF